MNSYLPLIIGLLYLVIHIASIIAKEAAKRKEREQKMEQEQRRRMATARLEVPPPTTERETIQPVPWENPATVLSPAPPTARGGRVDDLAARRKQQLDQLRARQVSGPAQQQMRTVPVPGRGVQQVPAPSTLPTDRDRMRREERARAEQQARASRQRAALARAQKLQQAQREADQRRRAEFAQMELEATEPVAVAAKPQAATSVSQVRAPLAIMRHLKDRNALREVIVLKEIIDPPLALRPTSI